MRYDNKEKIGLNAVESQFIGSGNWIFRLQTISDYGIDAHIERVVDSDPTGRKIELQIKTGESHVEETGGYYTFRFGDVHRNYWFGHQEPVLVIWYSTRLNKAFWEEICPSKVQKTKKGNKILIPKSNCLTDADLDERLDFILEKSPISKPPRPRFVTFLGHEFTRENLSLAMIEMSRFEDMMYTMGRVIAAQDRLVQVLDKARAKREDFRRQGFRENDQRVLFLSKLLKDQLSGLATSISGCCDELTISIPGWIGAVAFVNQGAAYCDLLMFEDSELEQLQNAIGKLQKFENSILEAIESTDSNFRNFSDPGREAPKDFQKAYEIYAESLWKLKFELECALEFIREKSGAMIRLLRKQGDG